MLGKGNAVILVTDDDAARFVDTVVARCLAESNGKKTKVRDDLKMGTRLLYASLKRGGHPIRRKALHEGQRGRGS